MSWFSDDKQSGSNVTVNCNCDTKESSSNTVTKTVVKTVVRAVVLGTLTGGAIIS
jgi:hypothetical protein